MESETVELKSIVVEDVKKEIIAFANTNGGKLYIGVSDDGTVIGVENTDEVTRQISSMVRDSVKPDVTMFIHYDTISEEGKQIVVAEIQRGTERPYYLAKKGLRPEGVYVRQGTFSVPATDSAIRMMVKETDGDSFEKMRSLEQELTFSACDNEFKLRNLTFENPQKQTLGLYNRDGIFTNLAYLLSDQCPHTIKIAVFQGNDQNAFKDRREFTGSVLRQLNDSYSYIDMNNPTESTFNKLLRVDKRAYPDIAIREALLNSIIHRDYSFSGSTLISIYSDRMEFVSIGGLVPGLELDDIMMGVSECRNQKLADVFYRLQLIEAYGTGIRKIMSAYSEMTNQPVIEKTNNAFKITLPNMLIETEEGEYYLDPEEKKIIDAAKENDYVTRSEVEKLLDVSGSTATRMLRRLVENNFLVQTGSARNTRYVIP